MNSSEGNHSPELEAVIESARAEAIRLGHALILPEHLFLALISEQKAHPAKTFRKLGVSIVKLKECVEAVLGPGVSSARTMSLATESTDVIQAAHRIAERSGRAASPEDLFLVLVSAERLALRDAFRRLELNASIIIEKFGYAVTATREDIQLEPSEVTDQEKERFDPEHIRQLISQYHTLPHANRGELLGYLLRISNLSEWELARALGELYTVPHIRLSAYEPEADALASVPPELPQKLRFMPLYLTDEVLTIAFANPQNFLITDEIAAVARSLVVPVVTTKSDIDEALKRYYPA